MELLSVSVKESDGSKARAEQHSLMKELSGFLNMAPQQRCRN